MWAPYVTIHDKKVYVAGGNSPVDEAFDQVYVYDINTDQWNQLPPPGHYCGIPHVIGDKLAIVGGFLSITNKRTNKVSTFDDASKVWIDFYRDLNSARSGPGIVTHLEHVIVAGGRKSNRTPTVRDDIEILNWVENNHWKKVTVNLLVPMWGFTPIILDDHLFIVGFCGADLRHYRRGFKIPVTSITRSCQTIDTSATWTKVAKATHFSAGLVPSVFSPMIVGGENQSATPTADIAIYDTTTDA